MPITKEALLMFKDGKLLEKKAIEEKKQASLVEIDRKLAEYKNGLMKEVKDIDKEGERIDAELNYLDYLIQEEQETSPQIPSQNQEVI